MLWYSRLHRGGCDIVSLRWSRPRTQTRRRRCLGRHPRPWLCFNWHAWGSGYGRRLVSCTQAGGVHSAPAGLVNHLRQGCCSYVWWQLLHNRMRAGFMNTCQGFR